MIRLLPEEVRSHLRSGVTVTHVTQCVEELVMNSLDAQATCVAVRIDLSCFKIQVVDNGLGMSPEQLEFIGNRYYTSKCYAIEDLQHLHYFGYRGEALASLKDTAAILEIITRTRHSSQTYCKMFQRGTALSIFESTIHRPSVGTTVTVHDLFYNLPVRRKSVIESLELEQIRYRLEGIALIHPNISFSLRNDVTGNVIMQTHKSSCMLTAFTYLFGAGKAKCLSPVSVCDNEFIVEGHIGKEPHYNKELQFVYINGRMVLKTRIHKLINHIFSKSMFFKRKLTVLEGETSTNSSPTKQNEKYCIFVLNIKCPLDIYDITFDPAKTLVEFKDWCVLITLIETLVWNFLKKDNLISVPDSSSVSLSQRVDIDSERLCTRRQGSEEDISNTNEEQNTDVLNNSNEETNKTFNDISKTSVETFGDKISTYNMLQSLHSRTVIRNYNTKQNDAETDTTDRSNDTEPSLKDQSDVGIVHLSTESNGDVETTALCKVTEPEETDDITSGNNPGLSGTNNGANSISERTESESVSVTADPVSSNISTSTVKTPNRPTAPVCLIPKLAAVVPSTSTSHSAENNQNTFIDSEMELEDPLLTPRKELDKNRKSRLCDAVKLDSKSSNRHISGINRSARVISFKEKIEHSLCQFYAKKVASNMTKISHITLTPEKKKKSRCFSAQIRENLAADDFVNPSVSGLNDSKTAVKEVKVNAEKTNDVLVKHSCQIVEKGSSECVNDGKEPESLENNHKGNFNLKQMEKQTLFLDPLCSSVMHSQNSASAVQTCCGHMKTTSTQTSPCLATEYCVNYPATKNVDSGSHKRLHPNTSSSVASKLSKLVHANNEQRKTASSEVTETSSVRNKFMTSDSFFETPRTVFARLSKTNVETESKKDSVEKTNDSRYTCEQSYKADAQCIKNKLNYFRNDVTSSLIKPRNVILNDTNNPLRKSVGSSSSNLADYKNSCQSKNLADYEKNECNKHLQNIQVNAQRKEHRKQIMNKSSDMLPPEGSEGFDVTHVNLPFLNYSRNNEFQSEGFTLSNTQLQNTESHSDESDSMCSYKIHEFSVTEEHDSEHSLFSDIFTPAKSSTENGEESQIPDTNGSTLCCENQFGHTSVLHSNCTESCELSESNLLHSLSRQTEAKVVDELCLSNETSKYVTSSEATEFSSDTVEKDHLQVKCSVESHRNSSRSLHSNENMSHNINSPHSNNTLNTNSGTLKLDLSMECTLSSQEVLDINNESKTKNFIQMGSSLENTFMSNTDDVLDKTSESTGNNTMETNDSLICSQSVVSDNNNEVEMASEKSTSSDITVDITTSNLEKQLNPFMKIASNCENAVNVRDDIGPKTSSKLKEPVSEALHDAGHLQSTKPVSETDTCDKQMMKNDIQDSRVVEMNGNTMHQDFLNDKMTDADCSIRKCNEEDRQTQRNSSDMWSPHTVSDSLGTEVLCSSNSEVKKTVTQSVEKLACLSENLEQTQDKWKKVTDLKTGSTLYVNVLSGNTMSEEDWLVLSHHEQQEKAASSSYSSSGVISSKSKFKLQEMLNSHLEECSADRGVKWRKGSASFDSSGCSDMSNLLSAWINPVFEKPKQVAVNAEVHNSIASATQYFQSLHPTRFTKNMLQGVKVLGQIDNKFIACVLRTDDKNTTQVPSLIVLIDQHAAHERVRLEQLTEDLYVDDDVDGCCIKQSQVIPPKTVTMTDEEMRLMSSFQTEINRIGIHFSFVSTSKNQVNIHSVPACIVEREASELKRKRDSVAIELVETLLKDHIQLMKSTGGARNHLPQTLHKVLSSQACHGAVKFGDSLTSEQCVELIENLSKCNLPFQCAHGRPSVSPLINLNHLKSKLPTQRKRQPNLWKISKHLDTHL